MLEIDEYAHLNSLLHRWDQRYKLAALFLLLLAFSLVRDLRLLPAMVLVSAALYILSRLPFSFLLLRLRSPGFLLLAMVMLLVFFSGKTPLFRLGPLTIWQEGCLDLLLVATKFLCILTVGFVMFGTARFFTTVKAMRNLGLPTALADMVLFSYRYIYKIGEDLERMETGLRLRGFRARHLKSLSTLASLVGSILVRSYEQTDRVYKAMLLRGYGQLNLRWDEFQAHPGDLGAFAISLLVAAGFVVAEIWLQPVGGLR